MTFRVRVGIATGLWIVASCRGQAAEGGGPAAPGSAPQAAAPRPAPAEPAPAQPAPVPPAPAPNGPAQPSAAPAQPGPDPILTAQQGVPVSEQQDVPVPGELRLAMEELAEALREEDGPRVLGKFSRTGGLRYVDTRKPKAAVQSMAFDRVERELNEKAGLYRMLFDSTGLRSYVSGEHAIPWLGIASDEFAPRGVPAQKVWVRWRAEGDTWLVDTVALPAAIPRGR